MRDEQNPVASDCGYVLQYSNCPQLTHPNVPYKSVRN